MSPETYQAILAFTVIAPCVAAVVFFANWREAAGCNRRQRSAYDALVKSEADHRDRAHRAEVRLGTERRAWAAKEANITGAVRLAADQLRAATAAREAAEERHAKANAARSAADAKTAAVVLELNHRLVQAEQTVKEDAARAARVLEAVRTLERQLADARARNEILDAKWRETAQVALAAESHRRYAVVRHNRLCDAIAAAYTAMSTEGADENPNVIARQSRAALASVLPPGDGADDPQGDDPQGDDPQGDDPPAPPF